jgi:hypothetical protein
MPLFFRSICCHSGRIPTTVPERPETDAEIVKRARDSRERARDTAKTSTRLLHEAARIEESVRQTEQQLKELKALVSNSRRRPSPARQGNKSPRS